MTEIDSSTAGRNGKKHKSLRVIASNYDCNTVTDTDSSTVSRNGQKCILQSVEMAKNVSPAALGSGYDCNIMTNTDSSTVGRNGPKQKSLTVVASTYDN